jgi:hypothetical protein
MGYALAADAVLVLHGLFVLFVAFGGLLVAWRREMAAVHLPAALWGAGIEFTGGVCPLTPLENRLRALAGEDTYAGGYVEHYLLPLLYPDGLTRGVQLALGTAVILLNVGIYAWALRAR